MKIFQSFAFTIAISVAFHIVIGVLLFSAFSASAVKVSPPRYIPAVVIEKPVQSTPKKTTPPPKPQKTAQQIAREKEAALAERKRQAEIKKQLALKRKKEQEQRKLAEQKRLQEEKRKQEQKRKLEEKKRKERQRKLAEEKERKRLENLRQQAIEKEKARIEKLRQQQQAIKEQQRLDELARKKAEQQERQRQAAAVDNSVIAQYTGPIKQKIQQNWARPPSARNGMKATLRIKLIPGGDVASVQVIKSSGDAAFDYSAEQAVLKAGTLPVPADLTLFNKQFRSITLIFSPEDL